MKLTRFMYIIVLGLLFFDIFVTNSRIVKGIGLFIFLCTFLPSIRKRKIFEKKDRDGIKKDDVVSDS